MLKLATKFAPEPIAFERAYRAGFRCVELWTDADVLAHWSDVAKLARHYPFEYVLHFPNRLHLPETALEQSLKLHHALGCKAMVIHPPNAEKFAARLRRLDPALRLGVENPRLTPPELADWAERHDGLTLDVEHVWKFTLAEAPLETLLAEVRALLARHGDKLRHVHLPGYLPGWREHRPMHCARELVFPVLSLLNEIGFDGLIVSEVDVEFQTLNDLRMDVLLFETWRERYDAVNPKPLQG